MKIKRVVNKRTGKVYEYPADRYKYDYKHKTTRGYVLVSDKGIVYKKNVEKLKASIIGNANYSQAQKNDLISDVDAFVYEHKRDKTKFTSNGFYGKVAEDEIERMFTNVGRTTRDVAEELGVSEDYLLNTANWTDKDDERGSGIFDIKDKDTNKILKSYKFKFTYIGEILTEIV